MLTWCMAHPWMTLFLGFAAFGALRAWGFAVAAACGAKVVIND